MIIIFSTVIIISLEKGNMGRSLLCILKEAFRSKDQFNGRRCIRILCRGLINAQTDTGCTRANSSRARSKFHFRSWRLCSARLCARGYASSSPETSVALSLRPSLLRTNVESIGVRGFSYPVTCGIIRRRCVHDTQFLSVTELSCLIAGA